METVSAVPRGAEPLVWGSFRSGVCVGAVMAAGVSKTGLKTGVGSGFFAGVGTVVGFAAGLETVFVAGLADGFLLKAVFLAGGFFEGAAFLAAGFAVVFFAGAFLGAGFLAMVGGSMDG